MRAKKNVENAENKFTNNDEMLYNTKKEEVDQARYLPTDDLPFKKMLASPDKIHIAKNMIDDIASYDPLGALKIDSLAAETPYNLKDTNQLQNHKEVKGGMRYTEVDFAGHDSVGMKRILAEMQNRSETHLDVRITYNISVKYTSSYAGGKKNGEDKKKTINYDSLIPVISIVILGESHFKDGYPIRYLRPHDARFDLYKEDLNMGLEIYLELDKDTSNLPPNLQRLFEFLRTGNATDESPEYNEISQCIRTGSFPNPAGEFPRTRLSISNMGLSKAFVLAAESG